MIVSASLVFPNLMMAASAEFFAMYVAIPITPDRSVIELRMRAERGADPDPGHGERHLVHRGGIRACEGAQQAVVSPGFRILALARHHERPNEGFHVHVLQALGHLAGAGAGT